MATFRHEGRSILAHRFAYELAHGSIPEGMTIDHKCRVRHCVRPSHLEPVTGKVNILRGESPSAKNARKTHCIRGHPLFGDNLIIRSDNDGRRCRTCQRASERRYKNRVKEIG